MKIKEIIVVEGRDDTVAIKRAVNADTIETNGSALSPSTIEQIRHAQEIRGVIVFTDPDYPGQKIRQQIREQVPGCKHAFIEKKDARPKSGKGIGVEHASPEIIKKALQNAMQEFIETVEEITYQDLIYFGLIAGNKAKKRREKLGGILKIGYTNGKQLHKRLQMFQISNELFADAMTKVLQEEEDE
ncbi:ribonuclease M5 [Lottiidibacillus patelloidae]|uniref:Ribonuclease M5 n=1 Tax=Lottiidibacillus patelloidae TaxID=2670334 RepID=A0A263BQ39_9BACI|nr:ribonuclease M5 [Lottiidibacillus patelloidae]OZM55855.1 ribonuclease M5 [Lottiidibacillus patelloidae]